MTEHLEPAWSIPRLPDFDLREFATRMLQTAMENLCRDKELLATAFAVTDDQIHCFSVSFAGYDQKHEAYSKLIKTVQAAGATALITCNDAFWSNKAGPDAVEAYYPGKLAVEKGKECIMVAVSGPAIQTWVIEVPYERVGGNIEFDDIREEYGGQIGFLEGWACEEPKVQ